MKVTDGYICEVDKALIDLGAIKMDEISKEDEVFNLLKDSSKAYEIIKDLTEFKFGEERWIQIYELAKDFATDSLKIEAEKRMNRKNLS